MPWNSSWLGTCSTWFGGQNNHAKAAGARGLSCGPGRYRGLWMIRALPLGDTGARSVPSRSDASRKFRSDTDLLGAGRPSLTQNAPEPTPRSTASPGPSACPRRRYGRVRSAILERIAANPVVRHRSSETSRGRQVPTSCPPRPGGPSRPKRGNRLMRQDGQSSPVSHFLRNSFAAFRDRGLLAPSWSLTKRRIAFFSLASSKYSSNAWMA